MTDARTVLRPPTLEETLAAQEDLDALCAVRTPERREVYEPNLAYGHDLILKAWAGLPADEPLKIALPHGVAYGTRSMFEQRELLPVLGYVRLEERERYRRFGVRGRMWPLAMPYVYAQEMLPPSTPPARRGTIFFPSHSTPLHAVKGDLEALADRLVELDAERGPVTICIFYQDVYYGLHKPYLDRGLRVVSAGFGGDPAFLFRLHHLCSMHEWSSTNEIGSQVAYSIASGCRWFAFGDDLPMEWVGFDHRRDPDEEALFAALSDAHPLLQRKVADLYLGVQHRQSPEELRRFLRRASLLDRFAVREPGADERPVWTAPYVARRAVRRLGRPVVARLRSR